MESLITLIVMIIVFNLIRSLFRGLRGAQTTPRKTVPVRPDQLFESYEKSPAEPVVGSDTYFYSAFPGDADLESDYDQETEEAEKTEDAEEAIEDTRRREIEVRRAALHKGEAACPPSPVVTGLREALSKKDPLVSAFIFHEIFREPPSVRRKR